MEKCPYCERTLAGEICPAHGFVGKTVLPSVAADVGAATVRDVWSPGDIKMTGRSTAESGWLLCQGQAISRADYSMLFSAIGTSFGVGDNSTTFNLPNMEGRVPVGTQHDDANFHELGHPGGEATHTLGANEMPGHTHGLTNFHWNPGGSGIQLSYSLTGLDSFGETTDSAGGGAAHNNLQPYLCINFAIKT
jgi:microcystin-dependent protein